MSLSVCAFMTVEVRMVRSSPNDRPSSFLAALGKPELMEFGTLLDGKIDDVATALRKP
jgi:hypothetical protein